jgi:hypothetical protein
VCTVLERETWIRRAMDVLRTLDPSSRRQIAHLYRDDNVIAFIAPAEPREHTVAVLPKGEAS